MRNKLTIVECASVDCARAFATWSNASVQYCPDCRRGRIRRSQRRFEESEREQHPEGMYNPDDALNQKLESAAFSLHYDAGPQDAAFHPGARFTELEVHYLLEQQYIAVDSIFIYNPTGRGECALRSHFAESATGELPLTIRWVVSGRWMVDGARPLTTVHSPLINLSLFGRIAPVQSGSRQLTEMKGF